MEGHSINLEGKKKNNKKKTKNVKLAGARVSSLFSRRNDTLSQRMARRHKFIKEPSFGSQTAVSDIFPHVHKIKFSKKIQIMDRIKTTPLMQSYEPFKPFPTTGKAV